MREPMGIPANKTAGCILVSTALALCLGVGPLQADIISLSGAENSRNIVEIRVDETGVRVALEVFPSDIHFFKDALADDWFSETEPSRPAEADRLGRFSGSGRSLRDEVSELVTEDPAAAANILKTWIGAAS